ncbi:flippase [Persephonella sp.]
MTDKIEILKKSLSSLSLKIVGLIIGFLLTLYVSRYYGASGAGILGISLTVLQLLSILGKFGSDTFLLREVAANAEKKYKISFIYWEIIKYTFIFSSFLSLIMILASKPLSVLLYDREEYLISVFLLSIGFVFYVLLNINFNFLKALRYTGYYSFFHFVSLFLISLLLLAIFTNLDKNPNFIVLSITISAILSYILSFLIIKKEIYINSRIFSSLCSLSLKRLKQIIQYSLPFLLASSLMLIMNWIDTIMISFFKSNFYTGIYYVVAKISMIITMPSVALNNILAPKFAKIEKEKRYKDIPSILKWAFKISIPLNFLILISFIIFGDKILMLFGKDFTLGYSSLVILSSGQFVNSFVGVIATLLLMSHREKVFLKIMLVSSATNILLNLILIPKYNILGASIASFISFLVLLLLSIKAYKTEIKQKREV